MQSVVDTARIAELLHPFLSSPLTSLQLDQISTYIDLLLRWNARINLTAIRQPEEIVTRHFGESLFAASHLYPTRAKWGQPPKPALSEVEGAAHLIDVGSGPGFPGIPIKIWAPEIEVTLIESNQKKSTFLREVIRALTLTNIDVFPARAEHYESKPAQVVTLRAVESFETILPTAVRLVAPGGHLALLISKAQLPQARALTSELKWSEPIDIPLSSIRRLMIGNREP
jgi:16S rRNA (guanine527-N7)-methyltransferase